MLQERFIAGKAAQWRRRADDYDRDGMQAASAIYRRVADELETELAAFLNEELTPLEAEHESGFSARHIRVLRSQGVIGAARRDLPRKPGHGVPPRTPVERAVSLSLADEVLVARRLAR